MATAVEQPLTRSELREELDARLNHYATKADLAALETRIIREMANQLRWMIGLQLLGLAAVAAIVKFLG
jgi:hypothetical protein